MRYKQTFSMTKCWSGSHHWNRSWTREDIGSVRINHLFFSLSWGLGENCTYSWNKSRIHWVV